jgi:hypothetical protein
MRIRIQKGGNPPKKRRKIESQDQQKVIKNSILCSNILGKELDLKMFNVRKVR